MKTTQEDFLDQVLSSKEENIEIPDMISAEVYERITTQELVDIINEFSFSNADVALGADDSMFSINLDGGRVLFFSNSTWSKTKGETFFGIMATLPVGFDLNFISIFNQNTKIGRLYTIDKSAEATIYRVDIHMNGGVTKRNIYYMINTFISCYNHLISGLISNEGVYGH
jgi:hypothetical protein